MFLFPDYRKTSNLSHVMTKNKHFKFRGAALIRGLPLSCDIVPKPVDSKPPPNASMNLTPIFK